MPVRSATGRCAISRTDVDAGGATCAWGSWAANTYAAVARTKKIISSRRATKSRKHETKMYFFFVFSCLRGVYLTQEEPAEDVSAGSEWTRLGVRTRNSRRA